MSNYSFDREILARLEKIDGEISHLRLTISELTAKMELTRREVLRRDNRYLENELAQGSFD